MSFKAGGGYKYDEYECSGDGPRPPVPGGESKTVSMTEGYSHVVSTNYRDATATSSVAVGGASAAGSAVPAGTSSSSSLPSYMRWAQSLSYLLGDREGVALFKRFVEQEGGIHQDRLKFFLACDGLADVREPDKIKQMIDAIYKFLKRTQIPVSEEVRGAIKLLRKNELEPRTDIFDQMYDEVRQTMAQTTFLSFLKSDIYLGHVQSMTSTNRGGGGGMSLNRGDGVPPTSSMSGSHSSQSSGSSSGGGRSTESSGTVAASGQMLPPPLPPPPVSTTTPTLITSSAVAANSMVIGTALGADHLTRSLTLPTLHEDSELVCDNIVSISAKTQFGTAAATGSVGGRGRAPAEPPMRLTKDSLLATEARRLEVRPPGAHGYSFFNNNYESYNTVSLQDSERQSYSSGQTDSDTASISTSTDGRPYIPRRSSSMENRAMRQSAMVNKEPDVTAIIPRTSRMHNNAHISLKPEDLVSKLFPKLEEIKKKQDMDDLFSKKMHESGNDPTASVAEKAAIFHSELRDAIRDKLPMEDTMDDQSILDMHVKRVWQDHTPQRSPGTVSPGPLAALRSRRTNEFVLQLNYGAAATMGASGMDPKYGDGNSSNNSIISGSGGQSLSQQQQQMRHSRSMPVDPMQQQQQMTQSRKTLSNKWPSMQTDSGISLFSGDTLIKKEQSSRKHMSMGGDGASMTTALQLEEARRRLEDESKRSRSRHAAPLPPPPMMMHMMAPEECTTVVFSFCDEQFPYRTKIPGKQPTLKQFKDYLPKKGNFRFFFKTLCEDLDNTVIQEEITNDSDILPLYEGKVMALVKPSE